MVEPFGIVAGAVGVAAVFNTCLDCFEYIPLGRHFGRVFQTNLLTLNCARLRLTHWRQPVDTTPTLNSARQMQPQLEIQTVKDALLQILTLFANTEKLSKKDRLSAQGRR